MNVTKGNMAQLARQFSNHNGVNRPVLDGLGLTSHFHDYKLTWTLERGISITIHRRWTYPSRERSSD